jgi:hypothetical protein
MADVSGLAAWVRRSLDPLLSWMKRRPVLLRSVLIVLAAALLITGLATGDTEEILFKGSIL